MTDLKALRGLSPTVPIPPQAHETTSLLSTFSSYLSIKPPLGHSYKPVSADLPGSTPPNDIAAEDCQSRFHKIWKSCCCFPVTSRRVPRSQLVSANGGDDPEEAQHLAVTIPTSSDVHLETTRAGGSDLSP